MRETRIKLDIPVNLPTVEEALWMTAITIETLSQPGLSRAEIRRLARRMKAMPGVSKTFPGVYAVSKVGACDVQVSLGNTRS